jgi:hypothetical protein
MKAYVIPSFSSGLAALISIGYYSLFAINFGNDLLGLFIFLLSIVSLVQIAFIPQAWVYIIAATTDRDAHYRFSVGALVELFGGILAALILLVLCLIPALPLRAHVKEAMIILGGLWIAGCSSPQGLARRLNLWNIYMQWMLLPNIIRLIFIMAYINGFRPFGRLTGDDHRWKIYLIFYLVPEIIRFLLVYPRLLKKFFVPVQLKHVYMETIKILRNWLFDVGSAITEVADKIVVGALLGPILLVVYFFARKFSIISIMFLEPYFAESYRRLVTPDNSNPLKTATKIYLNGIAMSLSVFALIVTGLFYSHSHLYSVARLVPSVIYEHLYVFTAVLAIDCLIAANRWGRFISHLTSKHVHLFIVRIISFAIFVIGCFILIPWFSDAAVPAALFCCWIFETIFDVYLLRNINSAAALCHIGGERNA